MQQFRKSKRKLYKYVDKKYIIFVKEITKVESIKRTELIEKRKKIQKLDSVVHMQANSQEMKCI